MAFLDDSLDFLKVSKIRYKKASIPALALLQKMFTRELLLSFGVSIPTVASTKRTVPNKIRRGDPDVLPLGLVNIAR